MDILSSLALGFSVALTPVNLLYCFLGGLDYVLGALVGAFTLVLSFEILHALLTYQTLIYAGIMILAMLLLPNGIISFPIFHSRAAAGGGLR